jgi:uncharacterized phage protein (TIGR01671 family)
MREIKFRAWYIETNSYTDEGFAISQDGMEFIDENTDSYSMEGIVIEQYTGLKDCNETDIYEGDIVRYGYVSLDGIGDYAIGEIAYMSAPGYPAFDIVPTAVVEYNTLQFYSTIDGFIEVIGNIHENPNLLPVLIDGIL